MSNMLSSFEPECEYRTLLWLKTPGLQCTGAQQRPVASSGCKFRKLQRTGARQWSVTSFGVQFASCEYCFTQVLQNCGVLCKEPEARCTTWLEFYTTAVCRGCSEPVSDSFGARVLNSGQWQVPGASFESFSVQVPDSGQLQASVCSLPAASTILLEFSQNCGVLCKEPEAQLARTSCPLKHRCTVKPSTASAWVEVMLNPPGVDWRIVNYVHDGYEEPAWPP